VQVEPEQRPACEEHRANPTLNALVFTVKDQSGHTSNQRGYADEQPENFVCENSVTASGNLKDSVEI
jgi:hypothetical protein